MESLSAQLGGVKRVWCGQTDALEACRRVDLQNAESNDITGLKDRRTLQKPHMHTRPQ